MIPTMAKAIALFDIDGVVRDVSTSYRQALIDTVNHFTQGAYSPSQMEIDQLKTEGLWNNDWEASQELIRRYFINQAQLPPMIDFAQLVSFFQHQYWGPDPQHCTGYICQESVLMSYDYLSQLTDEGIFWGFFSGAERPSAEYVLQTRLGTESPVLVAMEDAPGKPDPTGLLMALAQLESNWDDNRPVVYVGDTVADMMVINNVRERYPQRRWVGVGVIPPHAHNRSASYLQNLRNAGAVKVVQHVHELTPDLIYSLFKNG
jgi:HAD superfamily phosphatase